MIIESIAEIGKALNIRAEKAKDETPIVVAHMGFKGLLIAREVIDALLGQKIGWAQSTLYDELGAPVARMSLDLHKLEVFVTGAIKGNDETQEKLVLTDASLTDIVITLSSVTPNLALLQGSLSWQAAGDEVADAEPLLGKTCVMNVSLSANKQGDLLKAA